MAASKRYNGVRFTTSSTGTGDITVGSAVPGFLTPAQAGVQNGDVCTWAIEGVGTYEVFQAAYSSTGPTIARGAASPYRSTGSGNTGKITLVGGEHVALVGAAEDYDLSRTPGIVGADHGGGLLQPNPRIVIASGDQYATFETNSAYESFEWTFSNVCPTSDNQNLRMEVASGAYPGSLVWRAGSGYYTAQWCAKGLVGTGTVANRLANDSSLILSNCNEGVGNATNVGLSGKFRLNRLPGGNSYNFFTGQFYHYTFNGGAAETWLVSMGGVYWSSLFAISAVRFFFGVPGTNTMQMGTIDMRAWNLSRGP